MTNTNGQEWLRLHTWAVAGDVLNEAKYAHTIAETLQKEGYEVALINPRSRDPRLCRSLSDYGQPIDVLDLVIHPKLGLKLVEEAKELGKPSMPASSSVFGERQNIICIVPVKRTLTAALMWSLCCGRKTTNR